MTMEGFMESGAAAQEEYNFPYGSVASFDTQESS